MRMQAYAKMDVAHGCTRYFDVFWDNEPERYKSLKADARCEVRSPTLLEPCLLRPGVVKTKPVQAGHCIQSLHNFYKIIAVLCI